MADIFQIIGKISLDGIDKAEKELNALSDTGEKSASKLSRIGGVAKTFGKGLSSLGLSIFSKTFSLIIPCRSR